MALEWQKEELEQDNPKVVVGRSAKGIADKLKERLRDKKSAAGEPQAPENNKGRGR